jgi:hypothetical protein
LDTLSLSPQHQLRWVSLPNGDQVLLAQTPSGLAMLKSWPASSLNAGHLDETTDHETLTHVPDYLDASLVPLRPKGARQRSKP